MRTPRAVPAAILAVLASLVLVPGPAAHADGPVPSELTLQRDHPEVPAVFHDDVGPGPASLPGVDDLQFQATLTSLGVPVAGAEVTLERMLAPGTTWHALDTVTTDANGVAAFSTPVRGNGAYRAEYAGDVALAAATAAPVPLDAMRDFNAEVAQTRTGVFLHGNVNPGWGRHRVSWQRRTCDSCDWRTLSTARTSRTGAWRFQGAWSREGRTWWFRAKLAGTAEFVTSTSSMLVTSRQ